MSVEVLIPWRGSCPFRERALGYVTERLGWPVTVCPAPEGPWSKGKALWPAANASDADVLVVHDADVVCDGTAAAVEAVEAGEPWAQPHERVFRLTGDSTVALLAGEHEPRPRYTESPYRGIWGGGILVMPRSTYLSVPIDPRFLGWGQEDHAHSYALWFLAGEGWRGSADLTHLWHPPAERMTRDRGSVENVGLVARYRQARFKPNVMREIANEAIAELERGADVASAAA